MAMKIKTNHPLAVAFSFLLGLIFTNSIAADEVAQISGAASLSVSAGTVPIGRGGYAHAGRNLRGPLPT